MLQHIEINSVYDANRTEEELDISIDNKESNNFLSSSLLSDAIGSINEDHDSNIMVVGDEYDIVSLVEISLKKAGLPVSSFTDPVAALSEFRLHPADFDLVISDIRMSGVDGYELARQVKKIKPDVKILLTSALECSSSRDIAKDLSHLDISGFIEKPISVKEVRNAVLTLINKNTGFHYGPYIHLL
jgi:two-component system, NtrC family, sensor kinase